MELQSIVVIMRQKHTLLEFVLMMAPTIAPDLPDFTKDGK